MYTIFAFGIDKDKKNVMAHSDDFESLDSVRFAVCQAIAGIDGVAERMMLYCDGIMCVDFELPLCGRIDLANYSCAYIEGYTDCMCDDDEGDRQEAQDNEPADEPDDESDNEESFDPCQAGFKLLLEYFMMAPKEQVKRHSDYAQLIASLISGHMK